MSRVLTSALLKDVSDGHVDRGVIIRHDGVALCLNNHLSVRLAHCPSVCQQRERNRNTRDRKQEMTDPDHLLTAQGQDVNKDIKQGLLSFQLISSFWHRSSSAHVERER